MKSSWGNVKVIHDRAGRHVRGWVRKKYTRTHPYPKNTMRIAFLKREKTTWIKLRKVGLSINQIAKFSGRSTSVIQRALNRYKKSVRGYFLDMRKLPYQARMRMNSQRWAKMLKLWRAWEAFLLGESEKPP